MLSLTQAQKKPCKYHFVGQFEIAFPGFACPTRVNNAGQRMQTSMLSRRLAVRGENCLFWPLS